jgi:hypothetical protein
MMCQENFALKIARNIISVLHLQIRLPKLQALRTVQRLSLWANHAHAVSHGCFSMHRCSEPIIACCCANVC